MIFFLASYLVVLIFCIWAHGYCLGRQHAYRHVRRILSGEEK
jgi:hypothetical protein